MTICGWEFAGPHFWIDSSMRIGRVVKMFVPDLVEIVRSLACRFMFGLQKW